MRSLLAGLVLAVLTLPGCETETSNGYQGELSFTVYAVDTGTGWSLDVEHDIFWEGGGTDTYEVSCTIEETGGVSTYTMVARDTAYEQGFEMTLVVHPYDGTGTYEITSEQDILGFQMTLSTSGTEGQTFDLSTLNGGVCTVKLSKADLYGDFTCPAIEEYVSYVSGNRPFTVSGNWECAEIITDG